MNWLRNWFNNKRHLMSTSLYFNALIEGQTRNLLVTYVYQQSVVSQIASLFCTTILFIGLYSSQINFTILITWFIYSFIIALSRIGIAYLYKKQSSPEKQIVFWKRLFVTGTILGGLSWGFAGSVLFWFANDIQQTLIILVIAGITSGAVPVLASDLAAAISFLVTTLLPLIIQLFFQQESYIYSLFSLTVITYFVYMLVLAGRSHRLVKQTIGLQFEKEALINELHETNEKFDVVNQKLNSVETHDLLTGVFNRKLFMVALTEAIKRAEVSQKNLAVFYLDLDNFKFVNDAYGYEVGDELLKMIIKRIKENLREPDVLARLGGNELGIILENQTNILHITEIAKQVCQIIAKPFNVNDHHINISASVGVSVYPVDGVEATILVKKANKAMQYIKDHGHNNFHFNTTPFPL